MDIKELEIQLGRKENEIEKLQVLLAETKKKEKKYLNLLIVTWFLMTFVYVLVAMRM